MLLPRPEIRITIFFHRRDSTKQRSKRLQSEHIRYLIHAKTSLRRGRAVPSTMYTPCVMDCDASPA